MHPDPAMPSPEVVARKPSVNWPQSAHPRVLQRSFFESIWAKMLGAALGKLGENSVASRWIGERTRVGNYWANRDSLHLFGLLFCACRDGARRRLLHSLVFYSKRMAGQFESRYCNRRTAALKRNYHQPLFSNFMELNSGGSSAHQP